MMCRDRAEFKRLIEEAKSKYIDLLIARIDAEYQARGIPKRKVEKQSAQVRSGKKNKKNFKGWKL